MSRKTEWKESKINLGGAIIACAITLIIGFFVGKNWSNYSVYLGGSSKKETTADWSALNEVYSTLIKNYDGEIDKSAIVEGAKKGLVNSIGDVYTVYMDKEESEEFEKSLHGDVGAGVGIEMGLRDGYVRVIRTLPDNPARKAGILAGDILYKINDEEVYTLSTDEVANKIRGEAGSSVKITVVRDGEELSFDLVRETINNVSAYFDYRDDSAIITITRFDSDTGRLVESFADEILNSNTRKIILDLRNNGGGYVSAARDLLSLWIDGEKILIQKSQNSADEITYAYSGRAKFANMKTVVLVNNDTASASEIVTGALKDYDKATIIGEKTFGKGVVQSLLDLSSGTLLKVTTAHWYTPKENSINNIGIEPDVEVINTYEDTNMSRDPQLDAALAY